MPQYLISVITPTGGQIDPESLQEVMQRLEAVNQEIRDAGAWVFAGGLEAPSTATMVRAEGDDVLITDGPWTEGKEYVGGFSVIQSADLDEALGWTKKLARAIGLPLELRPFAEH
jgi:hypothetical protein